MFIDEEGEELDGYQSSCEHESVSRTLALRIDPLNEGNQFAKQKRGRKLKSGHEDVPEDCDEEFSAERSKHSPIKAVFFARRVDYVVFPGALKSLLLPLSFVLLVKLAQILQLDLLSLLSPMQQRLYPSEEDSRTATNSSQRFSLVHLHILLLLLLEKAI